MKTSFNKKQVLIFIVAIVFIFSLLNFFQKEIKSFFYSFSAPIQKVFWQIGERSSNFLSAVLRARDLKSEKDDLEFKNQKLMIQLAELDKLEEENKSLRQALDLGLEKDFKLAFARIISKDISQDFILIDKGKKDGILENMPVITEQKVLIGRISETYEKFSKIMLISNKQSSFDAKILNQEECSGVIKGLGNFNLLLDLISLENEVYPGDVIVTSYLGGIFPDNLLVGEVKKIRKTDIESFKQADIEPIFDISKSKNVFVILEF